MPFILPQEIIDIIMEIKEIIEIPLCGKYIIHKKINNIIKEQLVTIDTRFKIKTRQFLYGYHYGYIGYHDGYCRIENIRKLNNEEQKKLDENKLFLLPQQFHQSIPL